MASTAFARPRRVEIHAVDGDYFTIKKYDLSAGRMIAPQEYELGTPVLIHQPSYSLLNRWIESELLDVLGREGIGCIVFSPLAQGMLTDRYLGGIPENSRAARDDSFSRGMLSDENLERIRALNEIASRRGQSLAQMALAWTLRDERVTSALIGASSVAQLEQNLAALERLDFDAEELAEIDRFAQEGAVNIWAPSSDV